MVSQKTFLKLISAVLLGLLMFSPAALGKVVYVDSSAGGANNGTSWTDACFHLQDGLMLAAAGDEIRVAQGVYRPDQFVLSKRPNLGRQETFQLKNGVRILGGYAGGRSNYPDWRAIDTFETILSGDRQEDDTGQWQNRTDNCRHVLSAFGVDATAVLDGVTISGGFADGTDGNWPLINSGAGLYMEEAGAAIVDCTFTQNCALIYDSEYEGNGGGIYVKNGSPRVLKCRFIGNKAEGDGGGMYAEKGDPQVDDCEFLENNGGGLACSQEGRPVITNSRFTGNSGGSGAGVNFEYGSNPLIQRCKFVNNVAGYDGGALRCYQNCNATVDNCLFLGNSSQRQRGGGAMLFKSDAEIINCTFVNNSAAMRGGALHCIRDSHAAVTNCILWGNTADMGGNQIALKYWEAGGSTPVGSRATVRFCDIDGGREEVFVEEGCELIWEEGNIDAEPQFIAPGEGSFHLSPGSPCIDAGDNSVVEPESVDLDGNPRIANGRVDLGAYESSHVAPKVIYVDDDAAGAGDGSSWTDAFVDLQHALAAALPGDEIRVAQGAYKPAGPGGDRDRSFRVTSAMKLIGGYAGLAGPDPDVRDVRLYETILSGDLNGDDAGGFDNPSRNENSRNVVSMGSGHWYEVHAMLDGFTITAGHAAGDGWDTNGGGLISSSANFSIIRNCTFTRNWAQSLGGGLHDSGSYDLKLDNCVFRDNAAGHTGGAMALDGESMPIVNNCLFADNRAAIDGAIGSIEAYFTLVNCTLVNNHTTGLGGCMAYNWPIDMLNCIYWGNTESEVAGEATCVESQLKPIAAELQHNFNYCCVQGWTGAGSGVGNFGDDPLFVDSDNGDYHLKSQAGRWDDQARAWIMDELTSPCIDAGAPASPIGLEPFPSGGIVNVGAYGGTEQASKSYFGRENCTVIMAGDINGDCTVNLADLALAADHWLESAQEPAITYEVGKCRGGVRAGTEGELRFTVRVEGNYIHFEDMIPANCCADLILLNMQAWLHYIDIYEIEYTTSPCFCICDYPTTAVLGPFEPGTYELSVRSSSQDGGDLVGIMEVVIP